MLTYAVTYWSGWQGHSWGGMLGAGRCMIKDGLWCAAMVAPPDPHTHSPPFLSPVSDYVEMFRVHGDIHSFLYTGSPAMHSHVLALVVQVRQPAAALPASERACHACLFYLCLLRLA